MEEFNFAVDISASKSDGEMKTSRKKETSGNDDEHNVKLVLINVGKEKISVIKEIRTITGMGLKEAKDLSENVPSVIKESINIIEGKQSVERFKALGAHAELK